MVRDYKKIKAWILADNLVFQVYEVTKKFPFDERYGITSQLRRASVPSNIVEGSARTSKKEYLYFLNIARGSLVEVSYLLYLSNRLLQGLMSYMRNNPN